MSVVKLKIKNEILLFEAARGGPNGVARLNVLKEFICYLKYFGVRGKIDFSFSGDAESAHSKLTIKENYILDSVPTSLIKEKEDNFKITAANLANPHLKELIKTTECVNRIVENLDVEEKKLVSIVKALLSRSEYLFMDRPDLYLEGKLLKKVKAALAFEASENGRKILLRPQSAERWLDLATHLVAKDRAKGFRVAGNSLRSFDPTSDSNTFELYKKAG